VPGNGEGVSFISWNLTEHVCWLQSTVYERQHGRFPAEVDSAFKVASNTLSASAGNSAMLPLMQCPLLPAKMFSTTMSGGMIHKPPEWNIPVHMEDIMAEKDLDK
jgi:hypothetical protein